MDGAFVGENGIFLLAWKQRSGLGKFAKKHSWAERWIIVTSQHMCYYAVDDDGNTSPPRGSIDLVRQKVRIQVASPVKKTDASDHSDYRPSPHAVNIHVLDGLDTAANGNTENISSVNQDSASPASPAPPPGSLASEGQVWKLCFYSQPDLMQFLEHVHGILEETGQIRSLAEDRFEHDFLQGDHIFRWEMIVCPPVIYPIQIHGIVVEAGRNCVVVADFGLTGYGAKKGTKYNFAGDSKDTSAILAAWHKLRPNSQNQRLVVTTLTNPLDIRKWTKARYDKYTAEQQDKRKSKLGKISSFLGSRLKKRNEGGSPDRQARVEDSSESNNDDQAEPVEGSSPSQDVSESEGEPANATEPEESTSESATRDIHELPKSDPVEIVLARVNFLLEHGEDVLPPYHVFFSNSECIAVWCKTGRWSTIQTAVFLTTNSVGGAKSATMATIGVAAAHALLAPVVAVGGLLWVGAPLVMLKKSQEKWQEATLMLTKVFWEHAPTEAVVAAIQHWSLLDNPDVVTNQVVCQTPPHSPRTKTSTSAASPRIKEAAAILAQPPLVSDRDDPQESPPNETAE